MVDKEIAFHLPTFQREAPARATKFSDAVLRDEMRSGSEFRGRGGEDFRVGVDVGGGSGGTH